MQFTITVLMLIKVQPSWFVAIMDFRFKNQIVAEVATAIKLVRIQIVIEVVVVVELVRSSIIIEVVIKLGRN